LSAQLPQKLSQLSEIVEQLQEAVSPSDIKLLNQRCWLLQQQQADLYHQLDVRYALHCAKKTQRVFFKYRTSTQIFLDSWCSF
jgi:hypothetical protein